MASLITTAGQLLARSQSPQVINGTFYLPALNGTLINPYYCTNAICPLQYGEIHYLPSFAGNVAYLSIFALLVIVHTGLGWYYKTWGFMVGMICGLILEVVGYAGRLLIHSNDFNFNYFIIYLVCLTIGPAFLTAAIYLCLSRLVVFYGTTNARLSPKAYTLIFICCDIISLTLQGAGGGLAATSSTHAGAQTGINVMIAGLAFQVVSLTLFMILCIDFAIAIRRSSSSINSPLNSSLRFGIFPYALAISTITIFIRCCYRVAELQSGFSGSLANNQTLFMILEGPMIMIAAICLAICHPGLSFGGAAGWKAANWTWKKRQATASSENVSMLVEEPKRTYQRVI